MMTMRSHDENALVEREREIFLIAHTITLLRENVSKEIMRFALCFEMRPFTSFTTPSFTSKSFESHLSFVSKVLKVRYNFSLHFSLFVLLWKKWSLQMPSFYPLSRFLKDFFLSFFRERER